MSRRAQGAQVAQGPEPREPRGATPRVHRYIGVYLTGVHLMGIVPHRRMENTGFCASCGVVLLPAARGNTRQTKVGAQSLPLPTKSCWEAQGLCNKVF
jgi:hypothetical protein